MSPMAIIVVSAQISPERWEISTHHGNRAGMERANATAQDLTPLARAVSFQYVTPKPIVSQL